MSKHFGKFITEAQYTAGLSSLDFPNVSLVEQTGNVHYSVCFYPKTLFSANFGDVLLYDISGQDFLVIDPYDYNTTDFPTSSYEPIAICIFEENTYAPGKILYMSLKWMNRISPNNGMTTLIQSNSPYPGFYNNGNIGNIS